MLSNWMPRMKGESGCWSHETLLFAHSFSMDKFILPTRLLPTRTPRTAHRVVSRIDIFLLPMVQSLIRDCFWFSKVKAVGCNTRGRSPSAERENGDVPTLRTYEARRSWSSRVCRHQTPEARSDQVDRLAQWFRRRLELWGSTGQHWLPLNGSLACVVRILPLPRMSPKIWYDRTKPLSNRVATWSEGT